MTHIHSSETPGVALNIAILTISDTRTPANDTSGKTLYDRAINDGHHIVDQRIVKDDIYQMRAIFSQWIADPQVDIIISTGGTGITGRDSTPEAIEPLLDKKIDGFGDMFRQISIADIGVSSMQSRALGGLTNKTLIFCLPGSTGACRTGWDGILRSQLDIRTKPCNFASMFRV